MVALSGSRDGRRIRGQRPKRTGRGAGPARGPEYLITFPAGLSRLVDACLRVDLAGVETGYSDDSALVMTSSSPAARVARLPYAKNTFAVLDEVPRTTFDAAARTLADRIRTSAPEGLPRMRSFRLMVQVDGQLAPLDRRAKEALERALAARTGATVNARGGTGDELWLIGRRDLPLIVLAHRLSKGKRMPAAGALSTELSHLLVRLSGPTPDDRFLDPFCGSGALGQARAALPAASITCSDLDGEPDLTGTGVRYRTEDALRLASVDNGSVDVIVTDPPWGEHEGPDAVASDFYDEMAASFARVLDPRRGRLVLLIARRREEEVTASLESHGLTLTGAVPLLVNGHPATALTARPGR